MKKSPRTLGPISAPMLASAVEDTGKLRYPLLISPKLDGIRCLVFSDGRVLTRNFKPVPNEMIDSWLTLCLVPYMESNCVLDGELTLRDPVAPFQAVSSAVMSEDGEPDFVYRIFDFVSADAGRGLSQPFVDRLKALERWFSRAPRGARERLEVVEQTLIAGPAELARVEAQYLAEGYEGAMLRSVDGPYKTGRSTVREGYLLKLKRFVDSEAEVLWVEERMHNANAATKDELGRTKRSSAKAGMQGTDTLGALVVRDLKTGVEFSIGTGFDDALRRAIWTSRKNIVGEIAKYKYQPTGVKDAPRFPVFLGFRDRRDF